jgi:fatty-acid desaturase
LTAWGENWHKNHHSNAGSARFGQQWWQTDIGWYFICALEAVGLARDVKRPKPRSANRAQEVAKALAAQSKVLPESS